MTTDSALAPKPGNKVIRIGRDGAPWIEGFRCAECGAVVPEKTMACRACSSLSPPLPFRATQRGKLYSWSVVERSYPGVEVPFVSAIVDLDDGLTLKGTLKGVDIAALKQGMAVGLEFDAAGGARDSEGAPYVGFHFVPEGEAA